jgi:hypothetical protein
MTQKERMRSLANLPAVRKGLRGEAEPVFKPEVSSAMLPKKIPVLRERSKLGSQIRGWAGVAGTKRWIGFSLGPDRALQRS